MLVYRISRKKYAKSLSGEGAKRYGGRWNSIGTPIVYTAATSSLAMLEVLVHINIDLLPKDYQLITIEIPDDCIANAITIAELPKIWKINPTLKITRQIGDDFYNGGSFVALPVPSAVNVLDTNLLINPEHPDFDRVDIVDISPTAFDERLFK